MTAFEKFWLAMALGTAYEVKSDIAKGWRKVTPAIASFVSLVFAIVFLVQAVR